MHNLCQCVSVCVCSLCKRQKKSQIWATGTAAAATQSQSGYDLYLLTTYKRTFNMELLNAFQIVLECAIQLYSSFQLGRFHSTTIVYDLHGKM